MTESVSSPFTTIATAVLVFCAVVVTALLVRQQFFLPEPEAGAVQTRTRELDDADWKRVVGEENLPTSVPVTIVEFVDFQCPFCKRGLPALEHVAETLGDDVTIIRRHLPLTNIHPAAIPAALASECARSQDAFEAYHAVLFANQDSLSTNRELYVAFAEEVGISNIEEFRTCLTDVKPREVVEADAEMAREFGITGTPTLVVNGTVYPGVQTPESLNAIVRSHLDD